MANDDLLNSLMRRRSKVGAKKSRLDERKRGLQPTDFTPTVGGGQVQGMQGVVSPVAQSINWGGIAEKGMGSYTAAKTDKQLEQAEEEEQDIEFELANEIYQSTLKDDPDGARLIKMAQMGIPGADKALADHLMPKTQSMAVLMQAVTSGALDPSMAREVADQFGVSPDTAERAASYAMEAKQKLEEQKFQQKAALKQMSSGRGSGADSGKLSFQDFLGMTPEQQEQYRQFKSNRSPTEGGLTPGVKVIQAKELIKSEEAIRTLSEQQNKFENLRPMMDDPKLFGTGQGAAQVLSESGNPIISAIGTKARSPGAVLLEDYLNQEVLRRMSLLGGNDSNEELNRMRASLPKVTNNQEAALTLMDQLHEWQAINKEAMERRQQDLQSGRFFSQDREQSDYYREVKKEWAAQGKIKALNKPIPTAESKPAGKIEILEILPE